MAWGKAGRRIGIHNALPIREWGSPFAKRIKLLTHDQIYPHHPINTNYYQFGNSISRHPIQK